MNTTQTGTVVRGKGFTATLTAKTVNSIRSCRRCASVRTFVYFKTTGGDLVRLAGDLAVSIQDDNCFGGSLTPPDLRCPKCGGFEKVATVYKARVTEHQCNGKCMASKSGVCECSCGGKNHGMSYAAVA
jgi:hypothetical protein